MDKDDKITIRHYIETLIREKERQTDLRFESMHDAVITSKVELERRLEGLNHLRNSYEKDRSLLVTKAEYELAHRIMEEKVAKLEKCYI